MYNLNLISLNQLLGINRVGDYLAQNILKKREELNLFDDISQLREVEGIGKSFYNQLRDLFVVSNSINKDFGCGACSKLEFKSNKLICSANESNQIIAADIKGIIEEKEGKIVPSQFCPWKDLDEFVKLPLSKIDVYNARPPKKFKLPIVINYCKRVGQMDVHLVVEKKKGGYELITNYTRYLAGEYLGLEKIRAIIKRD